MRLDLIGLVRMGCPHCSEEWSSGPPFRFDIHLGVRIEGLVVECRTCGMTITYGDLEAA